MCTAHGWSPVTPIETICMIGQPTRFAPETGMDRLSTLHYLVATPMPARNTRMTRGEAIMEVFHGGICRRGLAIAVVLIVWSAGPVAAATFDLVSRGRSTEDPTREADRLIVFVHGIGGDASTFGDWPNQLRADTNFVDIGPALSSYAVAQITYQSSGGSTYTGQELATQIADVLRTKVLANYRHIFIITHSLGGILIKKALIDLARPEANQTVQLHNLKAVLFFGTPSDGADLSSAAQLLAQAGLVFGNVAADLANISQNSWLQSIEADWKVLVEARNAADFRVYCAYERLPYKRLLIVPQERVDRRCDKVDGFNEDHRSLVKPEPVAGRPGPVFEWTRNRIIDAQRSRGRIVLAMDSAPNAYDPALQRAGKSNSVVYRTELEKLKTIDKFAVDIEPLTTYAGWSEEALVFRKDLALLVIHLSAFEFEARKCFDQLGMNCSGPVFFPFIRSVLRSDVPVIIYSRLNLCDRKRAARFLGELRRLGSSDPSRLYFLSFEPVKGVKRDYREPATWARLRVLSAAVLQQQQPTQPAVEGSCRALAAAN